MLLKITSFCLGITSCLLTHHYLPQTVCSSYLMYVVITACVEQPIVLHVLIIVSRCFTVLLHCNSHFVCLS